jgi:uncharacterized protein (UPF0548 family)
MRTLHLRKPSPEALAPWLADQAKLDFSYAAVGATAAKPPGGFVVDRTRMELGRGEAAFHAATAALKRWEQFQLGWVDVWSPKTPLEVGQVVAVLGWAVGFWWLNCCRIVYTVDEAGPLTRFGFAYGTLPGHVERGEERFLVEWDRGTDQVFFDIMAFSQPNHLLTRLGYPFVRLSQKRFGRDSATAMYRAVQSELSSQSSSHSSSQVTSRSSSGGGREPAANPAAVRRDSTTRNDVVFRRDGIPAILQSTE